MPTIDEPWRGVIRVKAMIAVFNTDQTRHLVSVNPPTTQAPHGYHRLVGGCVEFGETFDGAIRREVREELDRSIQNLRYVGLIENLFEMNEMSGHEVVAIFVGNLPVDEHASDLTLTESDGTVVPLVWRPVDDDDVDLPLYPAAVTGLIGSL